MFLSLKIVECDWRVEILQGFLLLLFGVSFAAVHQLLNRTEACWIEKYNNLNEFISQKRNTISARQSKTFLFCFPFINPAMIASFFFFYPLPIYSWTYCSFVHKLPSCLYLTSVNSIHSNWYFENIVLHMLTVIRKKKYLAVLPQWRERNIVICKWEIREETSPTLMTAPSLRLANTS